jgi:hypothetical protein
MSRSINNSPIYIEPRIIRTYSPRLRHVDYIYKEPRVIRAYNPRLRHVIDDVYTPSFNSVIIEVFYSLLFSHHIPILMKGDGLIGDTVLFSLSSIQDFLQSYIGKILFYFLIYMCLHYLVIPSVKSVKVDIIKKNISKLRIGKKSEGKKSEGKKSEGKKSEEKKS